MIILKVPELLTALSRFVVDRAAVMEHLDFDSAVDHDQTIPADRTHITERNHQPISDGTLGRKPPRTLSLAVVSLASTAILVAQSEADNVAARERARVVAIQADRSVSSFYLPTYFGINADGSTETLDSVSKERQTPVRIDNILAVRVYRVAAVVTGIQRIGDSPAAQRFLHVWRNNGDGWKLAVSQLTAVTGDNLVNGPTARSVRSVIGPMRSNNPPCHGLRGTLDADTQLSEALAQRNRSVYDALTAPEFMHVDGEGRQMSRADVLRDRFDPSATEGAPFTRGRQFKACDLAVLFSRTNGASVSDNEPTAEIEVRVLAAVNGVWRQVVTQRTRVPQTTSR